jgi:DNA polymerase III subunit gamma/tau
VVIEPLTLKYRPRSFATMVGQKLTSTVLAQMVSNESVPSALLFDGPRGTGKTSAARILAMELNSDERDSILAGTSLSVIEIDAASNGSVADIRSLSDQLGYSVGSKYRVVIIDEAHAISSAGFAALLKILEEPPAGVVFVLVTTEPHKLPRTILSRLTEFPFWRVSPADLYARIIHVSTEEGIHISTELAVKLAEVADGSVRDAIKNLDFVNRSGVTTVQEYVELSGEKDYAPLLFAALLTNNHANIFKSLDAIMMDTGDPTVVSDALIMLMKDLFILKSDGHVSAAGKALEYRVKLAKVTPSDNLFSAIQVLWDLKTKVRSADDSSAALAMALVLIAEKLSAGRQPVSITADTPTTIPVASVPSAPRALSLSEVQMS